MDILALLFTFISGLALFIVYFLHRRSTHWKRRNVPHITPEFLYGNARGVNTTVYIGHFFRDMYLQMKEMGPLVGLYLYTEPVTMATDLDLIKTILVKDFNNFPNRGMYHNEQDDPVSANLSAIEDDQWRSLRHKLTPTFTSGKIKLMFALISEVAEKMIERISLESRDTNAVEVKDINSRFTTDVIGKVAFGVECNSLDDKSNRFYQMGLKGFDTMTGWKNFLITYYPNFSRRMHIKTFDPEVTGFYRDIIQQTVKYRTENNVQSNDFMSLLINMMRDSTLTFNQVWAQSVVFFLAGYETTATALTYCIYELSQNVKIQQMARESVRAALRKHNGEFTYEAVNEMQYVEQCVNESLRKHPPAPMTRRIVKEKYHVPNIDIVLEPGTQVFISITGIHFDPKIYPEPDKFDPDRFSPDEVTKRHNFAFLPFGEGPRICIGARFGIVEMKLALAKILMNYEMQLDRSRTPVPMVYQATKVLLTPASGIYVHFKRI